MAATFVNKVNNWRHTRVGRATTAVLALVLAYLVGSLALDTGNLWLYGLTLILLVCGLQNAIQLIRNK